jgi:hypothetical protein
LPWNCWTFSPIMMSPRACRVDVSLRLSAYEVPPKAISAMRERVLA